jgi:hypothetical protein
MGNRERIREIVRAKYEDPVELIRRIAVWIADENERNPDLQRSLSRESDDWPEVPEGYRGILLEIQDRRRQDWDLLVKVATNELLDVRENPRLIEALKAEFTRTALRIIAHTIDEELLALRQEQAGDVEWQSMRP